MTGRRASRLSLALSCLALTGALLAAASVAQETQPPGLDALLDGGAFVRVPAGEFLMGSRGGNADERPARRVRISRAFELGKYEVTQAQWEAVMSRPRGAHGGGAEARPAAEANPSHFKGPDLPVENVSWDDAQEFLRRLNALTRTHEYRLPTEAEWEYACRAGAAEESPAGLDARAWHRPNSGGRTHPVGGKRPNAWGLYDMQGNVLEWVQDWYAPDYYRRGPAADPRGPQDGSYRVYRGGSWYSSAADCRAAFRGFDLPANHYYSLGFRLVRTAK
jgi:formylglycine-generating enzyme required for sulfatase activity